MKSIIPFLLILCFGVKSYGQIKISDTDLNNLVSLGELYTNNNMCTGENFIKSATALRTPLLNKMVDCLIEIGKADTTLLQKRFLNRPTNDELLLWYVIREIHYNRVDSARKHLPNLEVAKQVLSDKIDERWLLDNYYYRIISGIAMLFNTTDLSSYNFELDKMGFENNTEKVIFFFNMMSSMTTSRWVALNYLKKGDKLLAMSLKLPQFNGKKYYYFTYFDFEDFEWIGYNKKELYKARNLNNLFTTLLIQLKYTMDSGDKLSAKDLYTNSILNSPEYFKYSSISEMLQKLYDKKNKQ